MPHVVFLSGCGVSMTSTLPPSWHVKKIPDGRRGKNCNKRALRALFWHFAPCRRQAESGLWAPQTNDHGTAFDLCNIPLQKITMETQAATTTTRRRFRKLPQTAVLLCAVCYLGSQNHSDAFPQQKGIVSPPRAGSALLATRKPASAGKSNDDALRQSSPAVASSKKGQKTLAKKKQQQNKGASLNAYAMLDHNILTMEEEQELGKKIRRAIATKETIATIIEEKQVLEFERAVKEQAYKKQMAEELLLEGASIMEGDEYEYEALETLYIHASRNRDTTTETQRGRGLPRQIQIQSTKDYVETLISQFDTDDSVISTDRIMLSDEDIENRLGIRGGREEVSRILIEGARARDKLISSNIRLVLSIAKRWCQNDGAMNGASQYGNRPSLEEAIQEGIVGLAKAADRYDYKRGLKFGTYATYWITNSVRNCFYNSATGSMRVPPNYHNTKQQYHKNVKAHYERTGEALPMDVAARELSLAPARLEFILRATEPLVSLDAPVSNGVIPSQGGKAGAFERNDVALSNVIAW